MFPVKVIQSVATPTDVYRDKKYVKVLNMHTSSYNLIHFTNYAAKSPVQSQAYVQVVLGVDLMAELCRVDA